MNRFLFALLGLALTQSITAETKDSLSYNIEARATACLLYTSDAADD